MSSQVLSNIASTIATSLPTPCRTALVVSVAVSLSACAQPADTTPTDSEPAAPASALIGERATPDPAALHARALVLDAHADVELPEAPSRYVGEDGVSRVAPAKMRAGSMDAVVLAVAADPGPRDSEGVAAARARADAELQAVLDLAADPANEAVIATTAEAIEAAHEEGKLALIVGFQNARALGSNVDGIDAFYDAGVRIFALTHMGHNDFADSSRPIFDGDIGTYEVEAEHGGLSPIGEAAIDRINDLGAVVDVSQLSRDATLQVLARTRAPIIASHSNVKALTNVRRNLSDEEIDAIGANEGVIHIAAFNGYLFDSNDAALHTTIVEARRAAGLPDAYDYPYELYWEIEDPEVQRTYIYAIREAIGPGEPEVMLEHLDYVVERIGVDHVGFGNDFNHGGGIRGFEDASGAQVLTEGLLARGYSEAEIAQIWGGNFLRVMRAAAEAAAD